MIKQLICLMTKSRRLENSGLPDLPDGQSIVLFEQSLHILRSCANNQILLQHTVCLYLWLFDVHPSISIVFHSLSQEQVWHVLMFMAIWTCLNYRRIKQMIYSQSTPAQLEDQPKDFFTTSISSSIWWNILANHWNAHGLRCIVNIG